MVGGGHRAFGHMLLISCYDDGKGVGAPRRGCKRDELVLNHRDSASVELLRRCRGNQWAQIAEEIYNYYKPDTGELGAVISVLGQFNLNSGSGVGIADPQPPSLGRVRPKESQQGRSVDATERKPGRIF